MTIDIIKIIVSALLPIVIIILGLKLTKHIEDTKNRSSALNHWSVKWAEIFFESHKKYQDLVLVLLSDLEKLIIKIDAGTQNDEDGSELQKKISENGLEIHHAGMQLDFQISNLSNESADIKKSTGKIYTMISSIFNSKKGDPSKILDELKKLNRLARQAHKAAIETNT